MYYRYEVRFGEGPWQGLCSILNPSESRRFERLLVVPKWYAKHPNVPSACWLTQYGYDKYHEKIEEIIRDMSLYRSAETMEQFQLRLRQKETLNNLVLQGKVQCISLDTEQEETKKKGETEC